MENIKEIFKNILYITSVVFCILIIGFIIFVIIINIKSFFNIGQNISSIIEQKNNEQTINILSLNLGILQGLTGIIGIGIVVAAYFNFTTIREKLKEIDNKLIEHDKQIKNYKKPNNKKDMVEEQPEEE